MQIKLPKNNEQIGQETAPSPSSEIFNLIWPDTALAVSDTIGYHCSVPRQKQAEENGISTWPLFKKWLSRTINELQILISSN